MDDEQEQRDPPLALEDVPLDDADLDAVNGGILSTGHTTRAATQVDTTADDFGRKAPRDRGGKVIWTEIDMI